MKSKAILTILSSLMIGMPAFSKEPAPNSNGEKTAELSEEPNAANAATLEKLSNIIYPELNFFNATLDEVKFYIDVHPKSKDQGFELKIIGGKDVEELSVKPMKLEKVSLLTLLKRICEETDTKLVIEGTTVIIKSKG